MLDKIKDEIHRGVEEMFAAAVVDEAANDIKEYRKKLRKIAEIAEILGIDTTLTVWSLDLKTGE